MAEDQTEFENLLTQLWNEFDPQTTLEDMLVEEIAFCYRRLRRVKRYKIGEIRKQLDTIRLQAEIDSIIGENNTQHFSRIPEFPDGAPNVLNESTREKMMRDSRGLQHLIEILNRLLAEVEQIGYLSESGTELLKDNFGCEKGGLTNECFAMTEIAKRIQEQNKSDANQTDTTLTPEECKTDIFNLLEDELGKLSYLKELTEKKEKLELEAQITSRSLPREQAMDKIIRYETAFDRKLYRAMDQLDDYSGSGKENRYHHRSSLLFPAKPNFAKRSQFCSSWPYI